VNLHLETEVMSDIPATPTTFAVLTSPFRPIAQAIEDQRKKHGNEALSWYTFALILIYCYTIGCQGLNLLATELAGADPDLGLPAVPASTLSDAFRRLPPALLRTAFQRLVTSVAGLEIPELQALGPLWCMDGSYFPALRRMAWAKVRDQVYGVKLHLCFSLNQMRPVDCLITVGTGSERQALRQLLCAGSTFIADRGYFCFDLLADIAATPAFFVLRIYGNAVYEVLEQLPSAVPPAVGAILGPVQDLKVQFPNDRQHGGYRLVIFALGGHTFRIATNRWDLSTYQIVLLYAYRWPIELIFRFLKHSLNGLQWLTTAPQGIASQFHALLITALLHLKLKQDCLLAAEREAAATTTCPTPPAGPACPTTEEALQQRQAELPRPLARSSDRVTAQAEAASFMVAVGHKLRRYWKVGIHWLTTLRAHLARPFTLQVRQALNAHA
jgi:hypothetical protein